MVILLLLGLHAVSWLPLDLLPSQAAVKPSATKPGSPSATAVRPDPPDLCQVTYLRRQHLLVHWQHSYLVLSLNWHFFSIGGKWSCLTCFTTLLFIRHIKILVLFNH